jgi:glycine/D-amino acid oxidase-like deaminating enzyme
VRALREEDGAVIVVGDESRVLVRAARAVACAGAWSDRLAQRAGAPADPRILPFRGGYLRLRPERREHVGPRPRDVERERRGAVDADAAGEPLVHDHGACDESPLGEARHEHEGDAEREGAAHSAAITAAAITY